MPRGEGASSSALSVTLTSPMGWGAKEPETILSLTFPTRTHLQIDESNRAIGKSNNQPLHPRKPLKTLSPPLPMLSGTPSFVIKVPIQEALLRTLVCSARPCSRHALTISLRDEQLLIPSLQPQSVQLMQRLGGGVPGKYTYGP